MCKVNLSWTLCLFQEPSRGSNATCNAVGPQEISILFEFITEIMLPSPWPNLIPSSQRLDRFPPT